MSLLFRQSLFLCFCVFLIAIPLCSALSQIRLGKSEVKGLQTKSHTTRSRITLPPPKAGGA